MPPLQPTKLSEQIYVLKTQANQKFVHKQYDEAVESYLDLLAKLPPRKTIPPSSPPTPVSPVSPIDTEDDDDDDDDDDDEEEEEVRTMRSVINANLSATYLQLLQPHLALKASIESLLDQPAYTKAMYRRAQANEHIATWSSLSSALDDYKTVLSRGGLDAHTTRCVASKVDELELKLALEAEREKQHMMQKFKAIGDSILAKFGWSTDNFRFTKQQGGGYSMHIVP